MLKAQNYGVKTLMFMFFLGINCILFGQELNCTVQINTDKIQSSDKKIFTTLQKSIYEFVNSQQWSSLSFQQKEKINCAMIITINSRDINTGAVAATITVQSRRPVYNSNYSSTVFNFQDNDFNFVYNEFDALNYSDNDIGSNLTATLAFYSYMILGIQFDTFGRNGGEVFFNKAQNIVNLAQSLGEPGWKARDKNTQNRYWLLDSYTNTRFQGIHEVYYNYHRLGMDNMYDDPQQGIDTIISCLAKMKAINAIKINLPSKNAFFQAKGEELTNIISGIPDPAKKAQAVKLISELDLRNSKSYQDIFKNTAW